MLYLPWQALQSRMAWALPMVLWLIAQGTTSMRSSGAIPFSANRSLVATTASERRGIMSNGFASTPHLFVFESYGREKNPPIQKIMSVPMLDGDQLKGVIQVCRKGEDGEASLKNFTEPELAALSEMAKVIGRYLQ